MKRFFTMMLGLMLCASMFLTGCKSGAPSGSPSDSQSPPDSGSVNTEPPEIEEDAPIISLTDANTKWLGRTFTWDEQTQIAWTASGFELNFEGTGIMARMGANMAQTFVYVYVDGVLSGGKVELEQDGWIVLAHSLEYGAHTVKVVKLTEASSNRAWVSDVRIYGGGTLLSPPLQAARKIEFIGDSITCGTSIEREAGAADVGTGENQNGMKTYAAVCAENLNADFNIFAISGWAIYVNGGGTDAAAIPPIYNKTAPRNGNTDNWDFSRFTPDVVVIALGTNDSNYVAASDANEQTFINKYIDFIKQIRGHYPDAAIIGTVGMMNPTTISAMKRAVAECGDSNVYAFEETWKRSSHPIVADHKETGDALSVFIAGIMDW